MFLCCLSHTISSPPTGGTVWLLASKRRPSRWLWTVRRRSLNHSPEVTTQSLTPMASLSLGPESWTRKFLRQAKLFYKKTLLNIVHSSYDRWNNLGRPNKHSQKKCCKSCHLGDTLSEGTLFTLNGCILTPNVYILVFWKYHPNDSFCTIFFSRRVGIA